jgi:D-3-phosphoglycerate dehydrogenase / 2-oxoglutarate reductase
MSKNVSFPKDKIHVVLFEGIHTSATEVFSQAGYVHVTRHDKALSKDTLKEALHSAHMVGIRSNTHLTQEILAGADKLMAIGCFCIGTNQVDVDAARTLGVPVFNAPHSNTRSVAELVIAEAVMLLRGLGDKNTAAHAGKWLKTAAHSYEVRGKTIGIVGYGHIGSQVSILAEAFGMHVLYHDTEPRLAMGNAQQLSSLEELLPQVDILTLHVPEAKDTFHLMDQAHIKMLKKGSVLINASRGNVVDLDALKAALDAGYILGAALDVFPKEPKSNAEIFESPLRGTPNVILTPHIGGSTLEAQYNIGLEVARKLIQYSDQGATIGAVNFPNISLAPNVEAHRLLHVHRNQPGVLGAINRVLAEANANILGQHLQTLADVGYVVTDVDKHYAPDLREKLLAIEGTIRSRILY